MDDEQVMNPQENPVGSGHLPAAGEVGNGPVSYHDPVTQPTDDETPATPVSNSVISTEHQTGEVPADGDENASPGNGGIAGLS